MKLPNISRNKIVLIGIILLDTLSVGILIPVLPLLFQSVHLPVIVNNPATNVLFWYALVIGIHPIFAFFSAPYLGTLSDRVGRKPVLVLSLFCTAISFGLSVIGIVSGSVWLLALGRVIDGGTSGNIAVARASLVDQTDPDNLTSTLGVIGALFGIGMILGPLLGSIRISLFDLPVAAVAMTLAGITSLVATFVTLVFFRETHFPKPNQPIEPLQLLPYTEPVLKPFIAGTILYTTAFAMFTTYWALFVSNTHNFSEKNIATMFVVIGISMAVTQGLLVRFIARYVPAYLMIISFSPLFAISFILLGYVPVSALYLGIVFFALMNGLVAANRLSLMQDYGEEYGRGYVSGIDASYTALSAAVAPLLLVGTSFLGVHAPFWVMCSSIVIMWIVTLKYIRQKKAKHRV